MRRQGQYDHSLHATKCSAPHSPRQGANTAPRYRDVWDLVAGDPDAYDTVAKCVYKFDHWLEMLVDDAAIVQNIPPGAVVEYKRDVRQNDEVPPPGASVVCFPLEPKPHDVHTPWIDAHWR